MYCNCHTVYYLWFMIQQQTKTADQFAADLILFNKTVGHTKVKLMNVFNGLKLETSAELRKKAERSMTLLKFIQESLK